MQVFEEMHDSLTTLGGWRSRSSVLLPSAVILAGVVLRLHAFGLNHSLSVDEAALARNIIDRPWTKLIVPLDYAQIAPPAFLLIQKGVVSVFGSSEYALRSFSLVCGIGSLWLCWAMARRILSPASGLCAVVLVALNTSFVEYSARAKPYAADVAATLTVALLAIELCEPSTTRRRSIWLALMASATVLFSFTAVFVLAGAAGTCCVAGFRAREQRTRGTLLIAAAVLAAGAACGTLLGHLSLSPTDAAYLTWFWGAGLMPLSGNGAHAATWLWFQLKSMFGQTAHYRASVFWLALAALGAWSFLRRGRAPVASILLVPVLLVIAASAAQLYPFTYGRVQLFLLPLLLILVSEGAAWCVRVSAPMRRWRWAGAVPMALILALAAYSSVSAQGERPSDEVKPFLAHVRRNWRPGDRLYVHYGTAQAFLYYAPRVGISDGDYVLGTCSRGSGRTYLRELDGLRGHARVWIVIPHEEDYEKDTVLSYLDAVGVRLDGIDAAGGGRSRYAVGYLYDLSQSPRTASISADRFPLPAFLNGDHPFVWSCYGVFRPIAAGPR